MFKFITENYLKKKLVLDFSASQHFDIFAHFF